MTFFRPCGIYPGTPLFQRAIKDNIIQPDTWVKYMRGESDAPFYLNNMRSVLRRAFFKFYLRDSYIKAFLREIKNTGSIKKLLSLFKNFFTYIYLRIKSDYVPG